MTDKYVEDEASFIRNWLSMLQDYGYLCNWTLEEIQELIGMLKCLYDDDINVYNDSLTQGGKTFFKYVISKIPNNLESLLMGCYRNGGFVTRVITDDNGNKQNCVYSFVMLKLNKSNGESNKKSLNEIAIFDEVLFDLENERIIEGPKDLEIKGMTMQEFLKKYENSSRYDSAIMYEAAEFHTIDLQLRDIIIESAALRFLCSAYDNETLAIQYNKAINLIDNMALNISNFKIIDEIKERMQDTYEKCKFDNIIELKKSKNNKI